MKQYSFAKAARLLLGISMLSFCVSHISTGSQQTAATHKQVQRPQQKVNKKVKEYRKPIPLRTSSWNLGWKFMVGVLCIVSFFIGNNFDDIAVAFGKVTLNPLSPSAWATFIQCLGLFSIFRLDKIKETNTNSPDIFVLAATFFFEVSLRIFLFLLPELLSWFIYIYKKYVHESGFYQWIERHIFQVKPKNGEKKTKTWLIESSILVVIIAIGVSIWGMGILGDLNYPVSRHFPRHYNFPRSISHKVINHIGIATIPIALSIGLFGLIVGLTVVFLLEFVISFLFEVIFRFIFGKPAEWLLNLVIIIINAARGASFDEPPPASENT